MMGKVKYTQKIIISSGVARTASIRSADIRRGHGGPYARTRARGIAAKLPNVMETMANSQLRPNAARRNCQDGVTGDQSSAASHQTIATSATATNARQIQTCAFKA